ncbi:divisome-associated lipoprotein YraP [Gilliamella sp. B2776]|uniref:division/outer membrane stress-associated lipid-binding lipoprotein n=1 Tax=unclassified Gilliamella TaxID=2685620 RepID=UPI00226A2046|nr:MULTISPECIES: division/outer membrane stress-associated lipid-binding lipoprotein [unclassified Gilliamella]MCX8649874.1 divisome-associated lipoprotein YraP [Gilliamella sp. B2779]MCX8653615.1 divisome-associated lipoprotein YraP [Gilliamella sp. B2737]MCX8656194.1 divisome-associated lipoprotein YraP [Gilliamella sp. B2894]MCX8664498.1 divisome-associated lipoprotein YraP [Gilliamella sp. B2887]MCX8691647.1 divisome-associated lipoprotein YraP [Gilliamella sp. B2776]
MKRAALIAVLITGALMLQGCITAAVIGAGATATAKVAADPRTTGTQVDDTTLNSRMGIKLKNNSPQFIGARIVTSTYGGDILLTGQANSGQIEKAESLAYEVEGVKKVYNQIRLGKPVSAGTITNDAWITTKVKSQLIMNAKTKARNIKVVTENSEVFLIGIVTSEDGKAAAQLASKVNGVKKVITLFTYSQN